MKIVVNFFIINYFEITKYKNKINKHKYFIVTTTI